jgi:NAD(P)-dependent dehydrogenase (short-subunit alcohol dehydrogenase family)
MGSARQFGFNSTTNDVRRGIDLSGKNALVTGASSGLGAETARALAAAGAAVTLGCRNRQKGTEIARSIAESTGNDKLHVARLDLVDHQSIREFADEVASRDDELSILVNNAGVMACPLARTSQGWELQFATCHVGHFLLTSLLIPLLEAGAPSRVVCLSSFGHTRSSIDFDDLHFERKPYDKWEAYGQAKTANALFAVGLDRRFKDRGIRAFALHPGAIVTDLGRHLLPEDIAAVGERISAQAGGFKNVPAGAATSVWAATAPELEGQGGLYLEDCGVSGPVGTPGVTTGYLDYAVDEALADRLWTVTEELIGRASEIRPPSKTPPC